MKKPQQRTLRLIKENDKPIEEGKRSHRNKLNDLTGKEWIYRTNSIELFGSTPDERKFNQYLVELIETKFSTKGNDSYAHDIRKIHPSPKPPQLIQALLEFFSKEHELVFDPFMGVGGTLIGASLCNRQAIGIDLSESYIHAYKEAAKYLGINLQKAIVGDSKNISKMKSLRNLTFDLILTDPPYGNMMLRNKTGEAAKKKKNSHPTPFTDLKNDIGNLRLDDFLIELKFIIEASVLKLRDKRYLLVFAKDFQPTPAYHGMLHYDIVNTLTKIKGLFYRGMKIWYDKTINLYPYGYPYAYVGNQLHQYILVFRKEKDKE